MKCYNFKRSFEKIILLLCWLILVLFPISPILADEARESPRPGLDKADERLKEVMTILA